MCGLSFSCSGVSIFSSIDLRVVIAFRYADDLNISPCCFIMLDNLSKFFINPGK